MKSYGYQEPLQINLVSPKDPREYIKFVMDKKRVPKKKEMMQKARKQMENEKDRKMPYKNYRDQEPKHTTPNNDNPNPNPYKEKHYFNNQQQGYQK